MNKQEIQATLERLVLLEAYPAYAKMCLVVKLKHFIEFYKKQYRIKNKTKLTYDDIKFDVVTIDEYFTDYANEHYYLIAKNVMLINFNITESEVYFNYVLDLGEEEIKDIRKYLTGELRKLKIQDLLKKENT